MSSSARNQGRGPTAHILYCIHSLERCFLLFLWDRLSSKPVSVCNKVKGNATVTVMLAESHLFRICLLSLTSGFSTRPVWGRSDWAWDSPQCFATCQQVLWPLVNRLYLVLLLKEALSSPVAEGSAGSLGSSRFVFLKERFQHVNDLFTTPPKASLFVRELPTLIILCLKTWFLSPTAKALSHHLHYKCLLSRPSLSA